MPYRGPRVFPYRGRRPGQRIAEAFRYESERKRREKEDERRHRYEDLRYDVTAAEALDRGIVPEGVERLPGRKRVSGQDMMESGRQVADQGRQIANAFTPFQMPEGMIDESGAMGGGPGPVQFGLVGSEQARGPRSTNLPRVQGEDMGLPPGDVRAPMGTSIAEAFTMREGQRPGYELPTGTEYRPQPAEQDTLVQDIQRAFQVSPEEARVLADRGIGPTSAQYILGEQDAPRDVSADDLVAAGVPESLAREADTPAQRVELWKEYIGRQPGGGDDSSTKTAAGSFYYQQRLQGRGRQEAIEATVERFGQAPETLEISRAEDDLAQAGVTGRGLRERFGEPRTRSQQAFLDIMSLPHIETPYQALQEMRDRGVQVDAQLEEYARGLRADVLEELRNVLMIQAGAGVGGGR